MYFTGTPPNDAFIVPSHKFGTFPIDGDSTDQDIEKARRVIDLYMRYTPGLSYVMDARDYQDRVGPMPTYTEDRPAQLWQLFNQELGYLAFNGSMILAKELTLLKRNKLSSAAQQFLMERQELTIPDFVIYGGAYGLNIPPRRTLDANEYREFPFVQLNQDGVSNWGNTIVVMWIPSPGAPAIPLRMGIDSAIKCMPAKDFQTPTNQPTPPVIGASDKAAAVATMRGLATSSRLRNAVLDTIGDQANTAPGLFEKLIGLK